MKVFCILIEMIIKWVYTFIYIHHILQLRSVNFILYQVYSIKVLQNRPIFSYNNPNNLAYAMK